MVKRTISSVPYLTLQCSAMLFTIHTFLWQASLLVLINVSCLNKVIQLYSLYSTSFCIVNAYRAMLRQVWHFIQAIMEGCSNS